MSRSDPIITCLDCDHEVVNPNRFQKLRGALHEIFTTHRVFIGYTQEEEGDE